MTSALVLGQTAGIVIRDAALMGTQERIVDRRDQGRGDLWPVENWLQRRSGCGRLPQFGRQRREERVQS